MVVAGVLLPILSGDFSNSLEMLSRLVESMQLCLALDSAKPVSGVLPYRLWTPKRCKAGGEQFRDLYNVQPIFDRRAGPFVSLLTYRLACFPADV